MGLGIKFDQKIKVSMTTLASLIQKYNIDKVYLLKMDCEGCEYAILRDLPAEVLNKIDRKYNIRVSRLSARSSRYFKKSWVQR